MNLTSILLLEESNNSTNTDKITAIRAILNNDLVLLVANNKDVSQSVIISEETLLKVFNDIRILFKSLLLLCVIGFILNLKIQEKIVCKLKLN